MFHLSHEFNSPQRLFEAARSIIAISEYLPILVDDLEQTFKNSPSPHNARPLFVMCNSLENLLFYLQEARPELFGLAKRKDAK